MAFVGFEFNKIDVEKKNPEKGQITINNHVNIVKIEKELLKLAGKEEDAVKFSFEYVSEYGIAGKILLGGSVLYLASKENVENIIKEWNKNKKVDEELMKILINKILNKCNIQTIILSDTVGLPPPVPLPHIKKQ